MGLARSRGRHLVAVATTATARPRYGYIFHNKQLVFPPSRDCPTGSLFRVVLAPHLQSRCLTNVAADGRLSVVWLIATILESPSPELRR